MGKPTDQEREFVRALMVLGHAPRKPMPIGVPNDTISATKSQEQINAYIDRLRYDRDVERYYLRYVLGIEEWRDKDAVVVARKIDNTSSDRWVEQFYKWQESYCKENI